MIEGLLMGLASYLSPTVVVAASLILCLLPVLLAIIVVNLKDAKELSK